MPKRCLPNASTNRRAIESASEPRRSSAQIEGVKKEEAVHIGNGKN